MSKKTLPNIVDDLGPPRLTLPTGGEMPNVTDEQVEAGTALLKEKHRTFEPAQTIKPPAAETEKTPTEPVKTANLFVNVPADLLKQISLAAVEKGATKSYIVCQALADAGFNVHPAFLVPDRRR